MNINLDDRAVWRRTYITWRRSKLEKLEGEVARVADLRYNAIALHGAEYDAYFRLLTAALIQRRREEKGESGLFFSMKNFCTG